MKDNRTLTSSLFARSAKRRRLEAVAISTRSKIVRCRRVNPEDARWLNPCRWSDRL